MTLDSLDLGLPTPAVLPPPAPAPPVQGRAAHREGIPGHEQQARRGMFRRPGGRLARVLAAVLVATGFLKAADGFLDAVAAVLTAVAVLAGC